MTRLDWNRRPKSSPFFSNHDPWKPPSKKKTKKRKRRTTIPAQGSRSDGLRGSSEGNRSNPTPASPQNAVQRPAAINEPGFDASIVIRGRVVAIRREKEAIRAEQRRKAA